MHALRDDRVTATRGSAHRPRTPRIGCPASTNGNSRASPEQESATGRPDKIRFRKHTPGHHQADGNRTGLPVIQASAETAIRETGTGPVTHRVTYREAECSRPINPGRGVPEVHALGRPDRRNWGFH